MREYGQVQSSLWQSLESRGWSDTGKLLAVYLLTGPHANGIGSYRLPDGYISADLDWNADTVSKGFRELSDSGFADRYDGVVFIPNFLRWNRIANGNIAKARFAEFTGLPKGEAKARAARAMLSFSSMWSGEDRTALETVSQTVSEGYANQKRKEPLKNPTLIEPSLVQRPARSTANRFEEFWDAYPVKKGKAGAEKIWKAKGHDLIADQIVADVKRRVVEDRQWLDGFAPHGVTYVRNRGWEDGFEKIRTPQQPPKSAWGATASFQDKSYPSTPVTDLPPDLRDAVEELEREQPHV